MINHLVFFKFKSSVPESEVAQVLNQLGKLKAEIPSMTYFSFGKNCSIEFLNKGFTHAMTMFFDDVAGRDFYIYHPEHKRIAADIIIPLLDNGLESAIVIDYEY
jgi:hypothetical protein